MIRNDNESFISYCQRLTDALNNKEITYTEWAKGVVGDTNYGDESLRRASVIFNLFLEKLSKETLKDITDEDLINKIKLEEHQLSKERKKLQTENLIYNNHLRDEARKDLFDDKIYDALNNLPSFDMTPININRENEDATGVICISDAHYGSEIELKSLFGEVVNVYNPTIFKARLKKLAGRIIEDYERFKYQRLIVFDIGDCIENILRISSLQKLKIGMVDSAIEYAEIMSNWIVGLRNALAIPIKYSAVVGNHDICRILASKPDFPEENMAKVIVELIKLRLKNCDGITVADYGECQFESIYGENILVYHGNRSQDERIEMSFWENYNDIPIDLLIMGHRHSKSEKTVGYGNYGDKEVIYVPSIVGADSYSKSIRKISKAGAKFILFEEDYGKTVEITYHLN